MRILNSSGRVIASNDNWRDTQQSAFAAGGSYHVLQPAADTEAAIAITLPVGNYTVVVDGKNLNQGTALAEIYDFSQNSTSSLVNMNARAQVLTVDNPVVAGLRIAASCNSRFVLRALGPTLTNYGVSGTLSNPVLSIYDSNGTLLRSCDNWHTVPESAELLSTGYAPANSREPAMIVQLTAGTYTAVVQGKNGGSGTAQLEAYQLK